VSSPVDLSASLGERLIRGAESSLRFGAGALVEERRSGGRYLREDVSLFHRIARLERDPRQVPVHGRRNHVPVLHPRDSALLDHDRQRTAHHGSEIYRHGLRAQRQRGPRDRRYAEDREQSLAHGA
jgi:hypothetical protein